MNLNWGIIGPGNISTKFVNDLALVDSNYLYAVASRSEERAKQFAEKHDAKKYYSSYEDLFADNEVDIIYIGTTHNTHKELAVKAMKHGKHVLCEKPLAINKQEVNQMIETSRSNNVFLMEAFWTRFNPTINAVLQSINHNEIGEVNYINADFCFYRDADPDSRLLNMELAGGALLDIGVYPIFLSYMIMGIPDQVMAKSIKHNTGADLQTTAILKYKDGITNMMCGFRSQSDMVAKIYGTEGEIYIDKIWHEAQSYRLVKDGKEDKFYLPTKGKGFTYEIEECFRCIGEGRTESKLWSHQDSLNLISICDEIRNQIDLKYPIE